jgi:hypothetical protein
VLKARPLQPQQYHSGNFSIFIKTLIKGFVYKEIFINIYSRNRYGCYNRLFRSAISEVGHLGTIAFMARVGLLLVSDASRETGNFLSFFYM